MSQSQRELAMPPMDPAGHEPCVPSAGCFLDIAVSGKTLYAVHAADNRVYRRRLKRSSSWILASAGAVNAIAIYEGTIFAVRKDLRLCNQSLADMTENSPWKVASKGDAMAVAVGERGAFVVGKDRNVYWQDLASMTKTSEWTLAAEGWVRQICLVQDCIFGIADVCNLGSLLKQTLPKAAATTTTIATTTKSSLGGVRSSSWEAWEYAADGRMLALSVDAGHIYVVRHDGALCSQPLSSLSIESEWTELFNLDSDSSSNNKNNNSNNNNSNSSSNQDIGKFLEVPCAEQSETKRISSSTRLVCISDTHGCHRDLKLPPGDVLIHAGDLTQYNEAEHLCDATAFFQELLDAGTYQQVIAIAGNHDNSLHQSEPGQAKQNLMASCTYLEDSMTYLAPACSETKIRVYGSPWTPEHSLWGTGFSLPPRSTALREKWANIPTDVDVLIVHGPPLGRRDTPNSTVGAGCPDLLREVLTRVRPRLMIFGHIHEGYGVSYDGHTLFVNASSCSHDNDDWTLNHPIVIDLPNDPSKSPVVLPCLQQHLKRRKNIKTTTTG
ncbi:unnamed protein product [Polarella glacialis]|uniref:Calcineurin-like phosphoesterase domain-containing protein n=2 Tax=Polarella glacialis TaxID=89957 RepID=A0A813KEK9_POLGL|nr:unnamed protein product [Polarella glacialis]